MDHAVEHLMSVLQRVLGVSPLAIGDGKLAWHDVDGVLGTASTFTNTATAARGCTSTGTRSTATPGLSRHVAAAASNATRVVSVI
jgi:hypothetical protein